MIFNFPLMRLAYKSRYNDHKRSAFREVHDSYRDFAYFKFTSEYSIEARQTKVCNGITTKAYSRRRFCDMAEVISSYPLLKYPP